VLVSMNSDADKGNSEWGWETRSVRSGAKSAWKNPGNGFGTGCKTYMQTVQCAMAMGSQRPGPDYMFAIHGERHLP
jgi:hypothetical protein